MSGECGEHAVECGCRKEEDLVVRKLLESTPSYLDTEDPTPICFDSSTYEWLNTRQIMERHRPVT